MEVIISDIYTSGTIGKGKITELKFMLVPKSMSDDVILRLMRSQNVKVSLKEINDEENV